MTSIKKNHVVNCINYANENRLFDKLNIKVYQVEIVVDVEIAVWNLLVQI